MKPTKLIELIRPNCFGDLLMLTGLLPGLKQQGYSIRVAHLPYFGTFLQEQPNIDEIVYLDRYGQLPIDSNRRPAEKTVSLDYPPAWKVQSIPALMTQPLERHMLHYWCELLGIPPTYEIDFYLSDEQTRWGEQFKDYILIQPKAAASNYKDWSIARLAELASRIQEELRIEVLHIGHPQHDPVIPGVKRIETPNILHAISAMKACRLFIGLDSVFNHASQAFKKKSIILWGSTNPIAFGYPQNINLVNGVSWKPEMGNNAPLLRCQPCYIENFHIEHKLLCQNTVSDPHNILKGHDPNIKQMQACMASNTVDVVFEHVKELFDETKNDTTSFGKSLIKIIDEKDSIHSNQPNHLKQYQEEDLFSLAQLAFKSGDYNRAKEFYQKRITLDDSNEEIYYSLYQIGIIAIEQNKSEEDILQAFIACSSYRPNRAEALYQLAAYYRAKQKYEQGYLCAKEAAKIPYPGDNAYFLSKEVYDYKIADELQICAWWIGNYQESLDVGQKLLSNRVVPSDELPRIRENLKYAQEKVEKQAQLSQIQNPYSSDVISKTQGSLIEVARLCAWGDILAATAVFPGLKAKGHRIRFITLSKYRDLVEDHPYIDELVTVGGSSFEESWTYVDQATANLEKCKTRIKLEYSQEPHLLECFCQQAGVPATDELSVGLKPMHHEWAKQYKNAILIHTTTRGSFYKNWPLYRWAKLAAIFRETLNIPVYQIGDHGDQPVEGVEMIQSPSIRHSIAALQHCRLFIGLDSVLNHGTRAVKKPALILWSVTDPARTGYAQNINMINGTVWKPGGKSPLLRCQPCWRFPQERLGPPGQSLICNNLIAYPENVQKVLHCRSTEKEPIESFHPDNVLNACMNGNTVDAVFYQATQMLTKTDQPVTLQEMSHVR